MWALLLTGTLVAFSCQDETVAERKPVSESDEIAFAVTGDSAITARSTASPQSATQGNRYFLTTIGKDSLFLYTQIEEYTNQPFEKTTGSRAASETDESLKQSSFYVDATYNGNTPFMNNTKVEWKDNVWKYSPIKYWPNNQGDYLDFYAYMQPVEGFQWGEKHQTFTYELPNPKGQLNDATQQPDLIFAQALNQTKQNINGRVNLHFYHALSAILFKIGSLPTDIDIKSLKITLKNVKESGTCTIANVNNELSFAWNTDKKTNSYSQIFNSDEAYAENGSLSTIDNETAFMMIPHPFADNAQMNISFNINDVKYSFDHPLIIGEGESAFKEWLPNTKYTYTLSIHEYVEVEVDDKVSGENQTIKSDVKIQNTGLSDAYIRAAIVGYWVNENGNIVASWKVDDNIGNFTSLCGNGWIEGSDGFYYHITVVKPSDYTSALFEKYELTGNPPIVGATLELNIVVQAVNADSTMPWSAVTKNESGVLTSK